MIEFHRASRHAESVVRQLKHDSMHVARRLPLAASAKG